MSNLTNISGQASFDAEVIKSDKPVLVDFWATWCGPCQMLTPVLEEVSKELEGKLKVVKVDTDQPDNQDIAFKYHVQSIPNLKIFKGGEMVKELIGYRPKATLLEEIKEFLS